MRGPRSRDLGPARTSAFGYQRSAFGGKPSAERPEPKAESLEEREWRVRGVDEQVDASLIVRTGDDVLEACDVVRHAV